MLKKHVLLLAIFYTLALTIVSLIRLKELPDIGVSNGDKLFHFLSYAVLTGIWAFTFVFKVKFERKKAIFLAAILCVIYGIIIEVLQGSFTTTRQTDVMDALANTLGVLLTTIMLLVKKKITS